MEPKTRKTRRHLVSVGVVDLRSVRHCWDDLLAEREVRPPEVSRRQQRHASTVAMEALVESESVPQMVVELYDSNRAGASDWRMSRCGHSSMSQEL